MTKNILAIMLVMIASIVGMAVAQDGFIEQSIFDGPTDWGMNNPDLAVDTVPDITGDLYVPGPEGVPTDTGFTGGEVASVDVDVGFDASDSSEQLVTLGTNDYGIYAGSSADYDSIDYWASEDESYQTWFVKENGAEGMINYNQATDTIYTSQLDGNVAGSGTPGFYNSASYTPSIGSITGWQGFSSMSFPTIEIFSSMTGSTILAPNI